MTQSQIIASKSGLFLSCTTTIKGYQETKINRYKPIPFKGPGKVEGRANYCRYIPPSVTGDQMKTSFA